MNVLLTSVGRRPYIVRWFKESLARSNGAGKVVAADVDPTSASRAFADTFLQAPASTDPAYPDWLRDVVVAHDITIAISINDFELSTWSSLPQSPEWSSLVRLSPEVQDLVEDKASLSTALEASGATSPLTWLGSAPPSHEGRFVVKGRYGSGSRGLRFVSHDELKEAVQLATHEVTTRVGVPALEQSEVAPEELVIIQEFIEGTEYGLDVVSDLNGQFAAVLARRKLAMRAGETDRAISVDAGPFQEVAAQIAAAVPHAGIADVDVIVDSDGVSHVIDINPRIGGGYPLSHAAGADIPSAYVAWARGERPQPSWLRARPGVVAAKYVEATAVPRYDPAPHHFPR